MTAYTPRQVATIQAIQAINAKDRAAWREYAKVLEVVKAEIRHEQAVCEHLLERTIVYSDDGYFERTKYYCPICGVDLPRPAKVTP